jgi:predicted RNase H-like HicB family nuclease
MADGSGLASDSKTSQQRGYNLAMGIKGSNGKQDADAGHTAVIFWDPDTEQYWATFPTLPGAHTCADTLAELKANLRAVAELVIKEGELDPGLCRQVFVGTETVEVEVATLEPVST